jgi:arginyl-tRNA synthetase
VKPLILCDTVPSVHFLAKREARGVDWQTVRLALEKPSVVEQNGDGRARYVRGDIAIVVQGYSTDRPVLITVLLRQQDQWTDEDVRRSQTT